MGSVKNNNIVKIAVVLKVLLSLFISCLILFKGEAGRLIHDIGAFIVGGNTFVGFNYLFYLVAIQLVVLYNLTINHPDSKSLKRNSFIFDVVLILINLCGGIFISTSCWEMPLSDAVFKFIVLVVGFTVVTFITSLLVIFINNKLGQSTEKTDLTVNNLPYCCCGRIERLPYFITKLSLSVLFITSFLIAKSQTPINEIVFNPIYAIATLICFIVGLFSASKRLRDIKWSQWLLLLWCIPYIGLCIGIPLLFVKSKYSSSEDNQS